MLPLAIALALLAQSPPTPPAGSAAAPAPRPKPRGDEMVCRPTPGSGRIQGPPVCRTRDAWDAMTRDVTAGANRANAHACRPGAMADC